MAVSSALISKVVVLLGLIYASLIAVASASPAPALGPTSDGTSIDQAIAYILMLVALLLTYIIH